MRVYVAHNFGGYNRNREHVEKLITDMVKYHAEGIKLLGVSFISPIHALGFMYDLVPYEEGMRMCLDILKSCDLMIYEPGYDDSMGVRIEKDFCLENRIRTIPFQAFAESLALKEALNGEHCDEYTKV